MTLVLFSVERTSMVLRNKIATCADRRHRDPSKEYFPTPLFGTRALCEYVLPKVGCTFGHALDPACGRGHMTHPLSEYFRTVAGTDIKKYSKVPRPIPDFDIHDYTAGNHPHGPVEWIITNPPFLPIIPFIRQAFDQATEGVAIFAQLRFIETVERYRLFTERPFSTMAVFSGRIALHHGRWKPKGATATSYAWFVWSRRSRLRMQTMHIPPYAKDALTRDDDARLYGNL